MALRSHLPGSGERRLTLPHRFSCVFWALGTGRELGFPPGLTGMASRAACL